MGHKLNDARPMTFLLRDDKSSSRVQRGHNLIDSRVPLHYKFAATNNDRRS
jgi:hypothetical protein